MWSYDSYGISIGHYWSSYIGTLSLGNLTLKAEMAIVTQKTGKWLMINKDLH